MRSRNTIGIIVMIIILAGAFVALQSSASPKPGPEKECLEEACQKQDGNGKMIWENLSHQFFSSF